MRANDSYFHPETASEDDLLTFFVPEESTNNNDSNDKRKERKISSNSRRNSSLFDIRSIFILLLSFIIGFYIGYDLIFTSSTEITAKTSSSSSSSSSTATPSFELKERVGACNVRSV